MRLENIKLSNFKNYDELELSFSAQVNCIVGDNGSGKTNLLDAVHYLSIAKSAFNAVDTQNIRHGQDYFMIKGTFFNDDRKETVLCRFKTGQKKALKLNNKPYNKLSEHVGKFPLVIIAPDDQDLVREGSEIRRKFFDNLLSQIDGAYLDNLIRYHHFLRQRNALLKQFAEKRYVDADLLTPYNQEMSAAGDLIYQKRKAFCREFIPELSASYARLSSGAEEVDLSYEADWEPGAMREKFRELQSKDLALQRTTAGVHRDDYEFTIGGYPLKKYGSQGQQKTFVTALKLAQFEMIKNIKGYKPILLLDDIFDKLDDKRINALMQMASDDSFGQLFITDARPERAQKILDQIAADKMIATIDNGRVKNKSGTF